MMKMIVMPARPAVLLALCCVATAALMACNPPAPSKGCLEGEELCFGVCVNTDLDPDHCGSCGRGCLSSELCDQGECQPDCGGRTIICGGRCVDTATDRDHCGTCGNACAPNEGCAGERCEMVCDERETLCGDQCVNVETNFNHCNGCDSPCGDYEECVERDCLRIDLPRDCSDVWDRGESTGDGTYVIDPDGEEGLAPFRAYCDMSTDGGRWTLVLNYLHLAGTNPDLVARTMNLPLLGSSDLGLVNEAGTDTWGHAGPALMDDFRVAELRFYGQTSGHTRTLHFKTTDVGCIAYFRGGTGNCHNALTTRTLFADHTAYLPDAIGGTVPGGSADQGDRAMTEIPFSRASAAYWAIRGEGSRWEMDDSGAGQANSTLHRIWIRAPSP